MVRFILLSFVFLAWAFYELSGGSDFVPGEGIGGDSDRLALLSPQTPAANITPAANTQQDSPEMRSAVTRALHEVRLDEPQPTTNQPTPVEAEVAPLDQSPEAQAAQARSDSALEDATLAMIADIANGAGNGANGSSVRMSRRPQARPEGIVLASASDDVIIADLGSSYMEGSDVRFVKANRVNLRNGPGTEYGVVTRLAEGTEVVVLEDGGAGWVRLVSYDPEYEGWIADYLLTAPQQ